MKNYLIIIGIIAVVGVIWFASNNSTNQITPALSENLELQGEEFPIVGKAHVPEGTRVTNYNSNPPTSGNHWPSSANWGFYTKPLPDEQLVHNLEHGGIWISYKDVNNIDEETSKKLEAIANKYPQAVIITERPENETQFAIASWGRLYVSDSFDQEFAEKFIRANLNNSPEKLASLERPAIQIGAPFPPFSVTEVGGRVITNKSLEGKSAIIWFTTSWCMPCQIGARKVSKLDDELGGSAFDVLVVFVDPREKDSDLISWRKSFAREDWMVAFDSQTDQIAQKVGLQYLDSKYLLDKNGVVKNIDFQIVDKNYINIIREVAAANETP